MHGVLPEEKLLKPQYLASPLENRGSGAAAESLCSVCQGGGLCFQD